MKSGRRVAAAGASSTLCCVWFIAIMSSVEWPRSQVLDGALAAPAVGALGRVICERTRSSRCVVRMAGPLSLV